MNNINKVTILFIGIFMVALCNAASLEVNRQQSRTYTLSELSKIDTAVIQARNPTYTFYIPTPANWKVGALDLDLKIHSSSILLPSSTLTLMVGNIPFATTRLNLDGKNYFSWKISIPRSLLDDKLTTLKVVGSLNVDGNGYQDIRNNGNWVSILSQSTIAYQYEIKDNINKIADLPYPFIQQQSPEPDNVSLILPTELKAEAFIPYLQVVNILSKKANWRGLTFDLIEGTSKNPIPLSESKNNIVLIAKPSDMRLSDIRFPGPFYIKDQAWYQSNGEKLNDKRGLLFLMKNPENSDKSFLVVTANSQVGIESALTVFNRNALKYLANHDQYYVTANLENDSYQKEYKPSLSFKEMGYDDVVAQGDGQKINTYEFIIPPKFKGGQVTLYLLYSFSPFVDQQDSSYLITKFNGLPLDGVTLKPGDARQKLLEVKLPREQVKPGKNTLDIIFDLKLPEKHCAKAYTSLAWGTVYSDSYIHFSRGQSVSEPTINDYPFYMDNSVVLAIPAQEELYKNKVFLNELVRLAGSLKYSLELHVLKNTQINHLPKGTGLIYLGFGEKTSQMLDKMKHAFKTLVNSLNVTSNNTLRAIDQNLLNNAFKKEQDAGFVAITNDKLNSPDIFIYGYTPEKMALALALLNDPLKLKSLSGNIAVAFQNGTYTSLLSRDIHQQIEKEIKIEKISHYVFYTLVIVLGLLILIGLLWFLIRATKNY